MTFVIYIRKIVSGQVKLIYRIYNFKDFGAEFSAPVSPMPMPEERDEETILLKMEGNSTTINLAWTIKEESSNVATTHNSFGAIGNSQTIWEQLKFFDFYFVPSSMVDKYDVCIGDGTEGTLSQEFPNPGFLYQKSGYVPKLGFRMGSDSPVTFNATLQFMVGNVVSSYQLDTASQPLNISIATSSTTGAIDMTWTAPATTNGSITGYVIQYRYGTNTWEQTSPLGSSTNSATVPTGYNGALIQARIATLNPNGTGSYSGLYEATSGA
jgi:hypothetical protein